MSFRARLMMSFALAVAVAAGIVTLLVSAATRRAYEQADDQRTAALIAQFRREFDRRRGELVSRVEAIAATGDTLRMAVDLSRPDAAHALDFMELLAQYGTIISSAQWLEAEAP